MIVSPPMNKVSTFLLFDGNAEAAIALYTSTIPNSKIMDVKKYTEGGEGKVGTIALASFLLGGTPYLAIDSPVKHEFTFTPAMSIYVMCENAGDVDRIFTALSPRGEVFMPLDAYSFSKRFVWFSDQFGVSWQLSV
jgi:predicted 3-demethylubiquinone-9 3-methyltransferase (glyoxalase superfamily)